MPARSELAAADGRTVHRVFTTAADGDLRVDGDAVALAGRRAAVAPGDWTWLRQVHGATVVTVTRPGEHAGTEADAAVTAADGAVLAVHTADCAGVLLRSTTGPAVVGAAHAGWRGLVEGILQATVAAMVDLGAGDVRWSLGPCISPAAYEFGDDDLALLADRYGPAVRAVTADGRPALDLRAGVAAALAEAGAAPDAPGEPVRCTALDPGHFSWRARADRGRQAAVTWLDRDGPA